jgi:hypothetical protein
VRAVVVGSFSDSAIDFTSRNAAMPAWPGGPCPICGEDMPANLIHCQGCRALLNEELRLSNVEIPDFMPLREISAIAEVRSRGYCIECPHCGQELRISGKYEGKHVRCKFCEHPFLFDVAGLQIDRYMVYADCPYCSEELRIANKYVGLKVACKMCSGHIQLLAPDR